MSAREHSVPTQFQHGNLEGRPGRPEPAGNCRAFLFALMEGLLRQEKQAVLIRMVNRVHCGSAITHICRLPKES